jgi:hypothetical protein
MYSQGSNGQDETYLVDNISALLHDNFNSSFILRRILKDPEIVKIEGIIKLLEWSMAVY